MSMSGIVITTKSSHDKKDGNTNRDMYLSARRVKLEKQENASYGKICRSKQNRKLGSCKLSWTTHF